MALFEPEETIGQQWHRLVGGASSWPHHPGAAVRLEEIAVAARRDVPRHLGGPGGVRLAAVGATVSRHRLGLRARLGLGAAERLDVPRFDGSTLQLPPVLDLLPERALNEALYEWLVAWFALAGKPVPPPADPLQADLLRLRAAQAHTAHLLAALPGLGLALAPVAAMRMPARAVPAGTSARWKPPCEPCSARPRRRAAAARPALRDPRVPAGGVSARAPVPALPAGAALGRARRAGAGPAPRPAGEEEGGGAAAMPDARGAAPAAARTSDPPQGPAAALNRFETISPGGDGEPQPRGRGRRQDGAPWRR